MKGKKDKKKNNKPKNQTNNKGSLSQSSNDLTSSAKNRGSHGEKTISQQTKKN
jgi:hypothetical protein